MNDVERVVAELRTAVEGVAAPPGGDVSAVVRRGSRRLMLHRAGAVGGAVVVVALAAGAAATWLPPDGSEVAAPEVADVDPPAADEPTGRESPTDGDAGTDPDGDAGEDCSAAGADPDLARQDVPPAVAETRDQIVEAAVACDYDRLDRLTTREFVYSFGGGDDPAGHWRQREADGEGVLADLVTVLELAPGVTDPGDVAGQVHVWPEVFALEDPEEADFDPVVDAGLYTEAEVERWLEVTGGYGGHRVGIDETGQWRFFVAGD